ncbi:hypothetical protein IPH19_01555 [Candidatus Uhrbacteria bacterium]|nr:MAG: hypothetical protein IPH19_01555 [Candidatus Uhrbacteria bacterium]
MGEADRATIGVVAGMSAEGQRRDEDEQVLVRWVAWRQMGLDDVAADAFGIELELEWLLPMVQPLIEELDLKGFGQR